ncbi:hypothetical protein ACF3NA_09310 [Alkanindiges sp. WGS2144]|uniref:hypothetical protein n=1 Tax=Alkanindiges sp. WGS2144 TaxID=3366808 RepID=UPI0037506DFF
MEHLVAMYKTGLMGLALALLVIGLAACQWMPGKSGQSKPYLSPAKIDILQSPTPQGLTSLHCIGNIRCEFAKLNNVVVINEITRQPTDEAIHASMVRFEPDALGNQPASKYFVAMQPGVSEVKLRFYPVTLDRAENFSLIHNFRAGRSYYLSMFRQRINTGSSSLLSMAAPEPLCVQLLEEHQVIRRFCRPFDPSTGLGEFIEQRVSS